MIRTSAVFDLFLRDDLLDGLKKNTNKQKRQPKLRVSLAARAPLGTQLSASPQVAAGERAPAATLSVPRAKRAPLDAIRVTLSHQSD